MLTETWNNLYTLSCIRAYFEYGFCVVEKKTGESNFFYNSCGTLIWVGIMPVKVDRNLSGIIRTYTIIHVQYFLLNSTFT